MESTGKLVIEGIANDDVAQKIIAFLCANAKNMTTEIASARLKNLPLMLASRISAAQGTRIASMLCEMGAEAVFIPEVVSSIEGFRLPDVEPVTSQTEQINQETPVPPSQDLEPSPQTKRTKPPANPGRELPKQRNTVFDSHEIAIAQKLLVWGVMAGVLSLPSPVVLLLAIPFQLYLVHRITKALKTSIALYVISLLLVMVPLINIILLLVLRALASKTFRDSRFNAQVENSTSSRLAPAYVAFLALYTVVGYSTSWVPWATYNVQMSSTGEKQP